MLRIRADDLDELLEGAGERDLLPPTRVASNAQAVGGEVPCGEPHAIVGLQLSIGSEGLVGPRMR